MGRLGLLAVWGVAGGATLGLGLLGRELIREPLAARPGPIVTDSRAVRDARPWARWTITEQRSAHHVLIVHVETRHLDDALDIARQIVDPVQARYTEVLVYFHRPGRPDAVPPRRVQWTRARGYVEANYEE